MTTAGLLAIGLVMSSLILIPARAHASLEDPTLNLVPPSDMELFYLNRIVRGFVTIAFPADPSGRCEFRDVTTVRRRWKEFYRSWFSVTIEADCPAVGTVQNEIWINCTQRNTELDCTLATPTQNIVNDIQHQAAGKSATTPASPAPPAPGH